MVPALGKEMVFDQAVLLAGPVLNAVTEPGSETALCKPPLLWNVTVSPAGMLRLVGVNVMLEFAVTVWFAAEAIADNSRTGTTAGQSATAGRNSRTPDPDGVPPARIASAIAFGIVRMTHLALGETVETRQTGWVRVHSPDRRPAGPVMG